MTQRVEDLQPKALWHYFVELSKIPRCSKHEIPANDWIESVARAKGCATKRDRVGNLLVQVPATRGCEGAPTVVLQGHADMVCEKNSDVAHDFGKDPIRPVIDGEWVRAQGTTLGADNGIGVAAGLAFLDLPEAVHGPLEILVTIDEETGLTGAVNLEPGFMTGQYLINLDSEEIGIFTVGCAGGRDSVLTLKAPRSADARAEHLRLTVGGLMGGHSGTDIHENRGNSIKILARVLQAALEDPAVGGLRLGAVSGGSKRNALPREARGIVAVAAGRTGALRAAIERETAIVREELSGIERDWRVTLEPVAAAEAGPLSDADASRRLVWLLGALPNGVQAMSVDIRTLVETSNNVGVLEDLGDGYRAVCASRSSLMPAMEGLTGRITACARLAGAEVVHADGYVGWKPDLASPLLARCREVYRRTFGEESKVQAIHAGLECGLFTRKYPKLDLISYGPDVKGAHSPDERVRIASVEKFFTFTRALLEDIAREKR
jgi:dipeptidase D